MPHIIVEYSSNLKKTLDIPGLIGDLHTTLAAFETIDITRLKSRAVAYDDVVVCDKGPSGAMVHITLKLLPRPPELVKRMTISMQEKVRVYVPADCAVTVEAVTLNPDTYAL